MIVKQDKDTSMQHIFKTILHSFRNMDLEEKQIYFFCSLGPTWRGKMLKKGGRSLSGQQNTLMIIFEGSVSE